MNWVILCTPAPPPNPPPSLCRFTINYPTNYTNVLMNRLDCHTLGSPLVWVEGVRRGREKGRDGTEGDGLTEGREGEGKMMTRWREREKERETATKREREKERGGGGWVSEEVESESDSCMCIFLSPDEALLWFSHQDIKGWQIPISYCLIVKSKGDDNWEFLHCWLLLGSTWLSLML